MVPPAEWKTNDECAIFTQKYFIHDKTTFGNMDRFNVFAVCVIFSDAMYFDKKNGRRGIIRK